MRHAVPSHRSPLRPFVSASAPTPAWQDEHWIVTSPYQQPRYVGRRMPWGPAHVRRDGSAYTACGLPTPGWFVFWDLRINLDSPAACRGCADAVRAYGTPGQDGAAPVERERCVPSGR